MPNVPVDVADRPIESLIEEAHQRQDFETLSALRSETNTSPALQARAEDLMVDLLVAQAAQHGPAEEPPRAGQGETAKSDETLHPGGTATDTVMQRISKMTVGQKLRAALFGGKEE